MIDKLKKILSTWKRRHLSLGGRVTLINSILNSLPTFFLSFFKAPKKVIKTIVSLQRNFLWGGSEEKRKIAWVRWEKVCLPKKEGGLGIKNIEWFNKALLSKWRWRLLMGDEGMWVRVVKARYGYIEASELWGEGANNGEKGSSWWRNIGRSGESSFSVDWFKDGLHRCLGKGDETKFWEDKWLGNMPFKGVYPRLFQISKYKNFLIQDCGSWKDRKWEWDLKWRINRFVWEK